MEKIGLKIVDLIHKITQLEHDVIFSSDFEGMVTLSFSDTNYLKTHRHLGYPGCERIVLEKEIINALSEFLEQINE